MRALPRAPEIGAAEAAELARTAFGVAGTARDLGSHDERNFRIDARDGAYVLKIANPGYSDAELDLQNAALRHVAERLRGTVPVPVAARDGGDVAIVSGVRLRLLRHLDGTPLREQPYLGAATLRAAGALAGRLAGALSSFDHPAADRALRWDVRRAADTVAACAPEVRDARVRELAERAVERLSAIDPRLRSQVIHGDVTVWNVLADRDEAGRLVPRRVFDFGDCARSWPAAECAVLAASACAHLRGRRLQAAAAIVAGFHSEYALSEDELEVLPALIAARAAVSAVMGEHRAALEPDNGYVAAALPDCRRGLAAVSEIPPRLAAAVFRVACGLPVPSPRPPRATGPLVAAPLPRGIAPAPPGDARADHGYAASAPVGVTRRSEAAPPALDLSVHTDALRFGAWRDPNAVAEAVGEPPALGRWGERRIVRDAGPAFDEPETVHLGTDLFVAAGTAVRAPWPGRVLAREAAAVGIAHGDTALWLRGIEPARDAGNEVAAGTVLGHVAPGEALPSHVHAQLAPADVASPPTYAPGSLAHAWLALCPDPGPALQLGSTAAPPADGSVLERRRRHVASPQRLYFAADPPRIERGWRQWLYDAAGRPYLDAINNVAIVGHSHPRVEEAAARQLRLLNTNSRFLYDAMGRFAERLVALVPPPLDSVFFVSSGSEANDLAIRLARTVTGHDVALCFEGCYHGWTGALHDTLRPLPRPTADPDQARAALADALATIERLAADGRPPAAFACEPVLGNSGGVLLPPGFLDRLYAAVRAAGGLCIADEVQVGYGRLGSHFWAFEQQAVVPDIVTIAKATGNGHPVAAVITTRAIADEFGRGDDLFASVGGTPVSCEVGLAVLDVLEQERLQQRARAVGERLAARLGALGERRGLTTTLHGLGLYRGLELRRSDGAPAGPEAAAICDRLLELGVIVQPTGPGRNVLKLKPPLCVTEADADFLAGALDRVLADGW